MLEEKNDNLPDADGNVANDSNESVQVETTIAETEATATETTEVVEENIVAAEEEVQHRCCN
jgi:hypothetical protein